MTDQELTAIKWWAEFWTKTEHWAFLGVVVTLAVEFVALKCGEPYKKTIDREKDSMLAATNQKAGEANEAAELLKQQNIELQTSLESEKKKTIALYDKMRWRHLTSGAFFNTLREMYSKGQMSVRKIWYSVEDPEAEAFATEIMRMVCGVQGGSADLARYSPSERRDQTDPNLRASFMPKGVCVFTSGDATGIDKILQSLTDSGVRFSTEMKGDLDKGQIDIEVDCNPATFWDVK
ncbi:MAG: hypothetical protein ABSB42_16985 [Tepidisphaeraceae bacterium]|jgi:hypothetical protein